MLFPCYRACSFRQLRRSRAAPPLTLCLIFLFLLYSYVPSQPRSGDPISPGTSSQRPVNPLARVHAKFWRPLYALILKNDPQCKEALEAVVPHRLDIMFDPTHNHARPDLLWMPQADIDRMRKAHASFVKDLANAQPPFYKPGTKGIAMTAGLAQLPVLIISLRMLRHTGCLLPVEVFLATDAHYDRHVCEDIFAELNAECLVLTDITRAARTGVALDHFQFKIMALLFSSFEEILLLDSDAFPVTDPTSVFTAEPFSSTGMIVWPDFWFASESPYFFEIANISAPSKLNDWPAMESGELMLSKSKHNLTLMLAAYYNYFGPQYYYPLQSQGAPGQGDKETFAWAARVMNQPFYAVHEPVIALGHIDSNGVFFGSAMAQHDPVQDFQRIKHKPSNQQDFGAPRQRPQTAAALKTDDDDPVDVVSAAAAKPLFIHDNFPKFDPSTIFSFSTQAKGTIGPCFDSNNTAVRAWMSRVEMERMFRFDVERVFWREIEHVGCTLEGKFRAWVGKKDICFGVRKYIEAVFPVAAV